MKEASLRLRLVVRRHNLPEVRVLFSIGLQGEPTIANLLEQVNETVPLESPDWGLDDYVVEIEDSHGHAFECLHFQGVSTILDRDEEVIIRPLFTVDRKKRLLSGRDQISADGKHLVDGVPFGRPRLKVPRGRPPIDIPPLKKRRITFDQEEDDSAEEEEDDEDDDVYQEGRDNIEEEEDSPLLLTEYGEDTEELGGVRVAAVFDDADNSDEGQDTMRDEEEEEGDLEEAEEAEEVEEDEEEDYDVEEEEIDEAELLDELRDIQRDNDIEADAEPSPAQEAEPAQQQPTAPSPDPDLARLNKITALRRAFPAVDCHIYEDVLRRNDLNERMSYRELSKSYEASMTLDEMGDLLASFSCPVLPSSSTFDAGAEEEEEEAESDAESTSSLVKRYDQHGFPSGSILEGSASRIAVEALRRAGHSFRTPVHTKFDDAGGEEAEPTSASRQSTTDRVVGRSSEESGQLRQGHNADEIVLDEDEEDSDTSDSSSSDSEEEDESDQEASDDESEDEEDDDNGDASDNDSSSDSDSDDTSSDDSSEDSDDSQEDSGPEVASTKPSAKPALSQGDLSRGSSGKGSQQTAQSGRSKEARKGHTETQDANMEDESSSSEDSSDSSSASESDESSSDESSDDASKQRTTSSSTLASAKTGIIGSNKASTKSLPAVTTKRSPPGQGLKKTRSRNARRKEALKARRAELAKAATPSTTVLAAIGSDEQPEVNNSEFLQRKKALLEKLASGTSETASSEPRDAASAAQPDTVMDGNEVPSIQEMPEQLRESAAADTAAEPASQRRSKLDVSAGRRMLFASLGLRNPKNKADEEKIRGDLMKGVRPLVNHRISETAPGEKDESAIAEPASEGPENEDAEAWRTKIIYRAVECCQEDVELSEPPFPFVQRWDPQQQNAWRDRRGGRGKRKQRNQAGFYEDDSTLPSAKKQKQWDDRVDGDSSFADNANDDTQGQDAELNYDDIPDSVLDKTPAEQPSQLTDMDDLPSLPKDLTTLSPLHLAEAKPGMVITWKQMLVSKATNWAPQVLDLTAVIVSIDEAAEELRVVLARRDRHLDGNEKTFDEDGNRVYDRFDAPDDDDDTDSNNAEGYRTIQYSDMMDPRIVQQPLPSLEKTTLHTIVESQDQADMVMADSEGHTGDGLEKEASDDLHNAMLTPNDHHEPEKEHREFPTNPENHGRNNRPDESSYGSVIPDSMPNGQIEYPDHVLGDNSDGEAQDISITDDRRHDISAMIQEAGFRSDVTPAVATEPRFSMEDLSSPSRQLEEMSEAAAASSHKASSSSGQAHSARSVSSLHNTTKPASFDGAADQPSPPANEQDTPKANSAGDTVVYPQLPVITSSASSVHSGRQPDNDISMDWGDDDLLHRSEELGEEAGTLDDSRIETKMDGSTPTKPAAPVTDDNDRPFDSSPLPTLDELFCTASQSRATQSPVRAKLSAAAKPRKPEAMRDLEYEEIMRRVDDSDGSEEDLDQIKESTHPTPNSITWDEQRGQIKEERWSQDAVGASKNKKTDKQTSSPPSVVEAASPVPKLESVLPSISPPRKRRAAAQQKRDGRFSIPEGSQVVSFLTSSPEPEVEEHYAEDSVDSTYEDPDPDPPGGCGWVKRALPGRADRTRRGVSLSALPADWGRRANGAGKRPSSSLNGGKAGRGKRKTSARF